jgi:hypothetical protein
MKSIQWHACLLLGVLLIITGWVNAKPVLDEASLSSDSSKLFVLWTSGDKEVAMKMVYMYTYNAKKNGWWDTIRFIVWGPSSKLLAEDAELQAYLKKMKDEGVELYACKACADLYGVSDKLEELGLTVKYVGKELTDLIQSGWHQLTF